MTPKLPRSLLLFAAVASTVSAQSLMSTYGEVVQGVGDAVNALPGVTIGGTSPYSVPVMDLDGNMLWRAKLTGGAIVANSDDQAMFYGSCAGNVTMLLQRGAPEPTGLMPGVTVNYSATAWDAARLSPTNGYMLMGSTLAGAAAGVTTGNDTCLFWGPVGTLTLLVREGDPAPSGGAAFTGNISGAQNVTGLNSSGTAICKVKLVGGDVNTAIQNDDAWLIGTPGQLNFMCREADPLLGGAVAVGTLDGFKPEIDELGRVLFVQPLSQTLGTTPATAANDATIMLHTPGSGLSIVMREGDPAPGSGGCVYGSISSGSGWSNHAFSRTTGRVVFTNSMTGGDATTNTVDTAVFAGDISGTFARVAREGEAAPTGVSGEVYQALFPNGIPQINDAGTVVFVAQLGPAGFVSTTSDVAVFRAVPPYGPNDVQMIVREGDAVAGLPPGWIIGNTNGGGMTSSGTTLMLNDNDGVLIAVAGVGDPTATNFGSAAMIGWDPQHGARLASMVGDTITYQSAAQVQSATPGILAISSGDGGNLSFHNNGDFCARMFFTGTVPTAVMRAHLGSLVCEPSSVPATGGVPQNLHIDCGAAHAGEIYFVIATSLGTRPGFASPFGPQHVPLNLDLLWTIESINNANTAVWVNTLGVLDGNGAATAAFVMPPGFSFLAGTLVHHAVAVFGLGGNGTYVSEPGNLRIL